MLKNIIKKILGHNKKATQKENKGYQILTREAFIQWSIWEQGAVNTSKESIEEIKRRWEKVRQGYEFVVLCGDMIYSVGYFNKVILGGYEIGAVSGGYSFIKESPNGIEFAVGKIAGEKAAVEPLKVSGSRVVENKKNNGIVVEVSLKGHEEVKTFLKECKTDIQKLNNEMDVLKSKLAIK